MKKLSEKENKHAAAVLVSMAEGLREQAYTETGESDHPAIHAIAVQLINLAGAMEALSVALRHPQLDLEIGQEPDLPF